MGLVKGEGLRGKVFWQKGKGSGLSPRPCDRRGLWTWPTKGYRPPVKGIYLLNLVRLVYLTKGKRLFHSAGLGYLILVMKA
jgi:hypothetical protein